MVSRSLTQFERPHGELKSRISHSIKRRSGLFSCFFFFFLLIFFPQLKLFSNPTTLAASPTHSGPQSRSAGRAELQQSRVTGAGRSVTSATSGVVKDFPSQAPALCLSQVP